MDELVLKGEGIIWSIFIKKDWIFSVLYVVASSLPSFAVFDGVDARLHASSKHRKRFNIIDDVKGITTNTLLVSDSEVEPLGCNAFRVDISLQCQKILFTIGLRAGCESQISWLEPALELQNSLFSRVVGVPSLHLVILVCFARCKSIVIGDIQLLMRLVDGISEYLGHALPDLMHVLLRNKIFIPQFMQLFAISDNLLQISRLGDDKIKKWTGFDGIFALDGQGLVKMAVGLSVSLFDHLVTIIFINTAQRIGCK